MSWPPSYPEDPRSHLSLALRRLKAKDEAGAEVELLAGQRSPLINLPSMPREVGPSIRTLLIELYLREDNLHEARAEAAPFCLYPEAASPTETRLLQRHRLCEPIS